MGQQFARWSACATIGLTALVLSDEAAAQTLESLPAVTLEVFDQCTDMGIDRSALPEAAGAMCQTVFEPCHDRLGLAQSPLDEPFITARMPDLRRCYEADVQRFAYALVDAAHQAEEAGAIQAPAEIMLIGLAEEVGRWCSAYFADGRDTRYRYDACLADSWRHQFSLVHTILQVNR